MSNPLESWTEEQRSAYLYRACADAEAGTPRADLFTRLAGEAEAQAAIWRAQLTASGKPAPGTHGHSLDSVSVGSTDLQSGSTNTIPANQAPTVTLNFTNGGTNNEKNVVCKVSISGTNLTAKTTVPQTTAGQTGSCQVTLPSAPPAGNYTLSAEIAPVPGEKKVDNNVSNFPVTVQ